jgi:hypothetical protein
MKSILLINHFRIFTGIWHCLIVYQKNYTSTSFDSIEFIQLVEEYVAWALYTVLTKVAYICLLDYQNTVSCSNLFYLT